MPLNSAAAPPCCCRCTAAASHALPCDPRPAPQPGNPRPPAARLPRCPQAWLQEFAWTEAELPKRLRERESTLAHADSSVHGGGHEHKAHLLSKLAQEPMFCFEVGQGGLGSCPTA